MDVTLDVEDIRSLLPHRFPLLLVDRILEVEPGKRIVGLKNVTVNEAFFIGHFPSQAIMPGVLIIESMAQIAGLMIQLMPEYRGKLAYIGEIENARFRRPVVPGDTLITEAVLLKIRSKIGKVHMITRVEDTIVAECDLTFALMDQRPAEATQAKLERIGLWESGGDDRSE
jgi:3-hydroxyacyl-[acyl-carrier-protein] dehydratase